MIINHSAAELFWLNGILDKVDDGFCADGGQ